MHSYDKQCSHPGLPPTIIWVLVINLSYSRYGGVSTSLVSLLSAETLETKSLFISFISMHHSHDLIKET